MAKERRDSLPGIPSTRICRITSSAHTAIKETEKEMNAWLIGLVYVCILRKDVLIDMTMRHDRRRRKANAQRKSDPVRFMVGWKAHERFDVSQKN